MILVLTCTCGGAERLARKFLKRAGYPNWMNIPIYKGKDKSKAVLSAIPQEYLLNPKTCSLISHIDNNSKYVVIFGYGDSLVRWTDVASGGVKEQIDADIIVDKFA